MASTGQRKETSSNNGLEIGKKFLTSDVRNGNAAFLENHLVSVLFFREVNHKNHFLFRSFFFPKWQKFSYLIQILVKKKSLKLTKKKLKRRLKKEKLLIIFSLPLKKFP